MKNTLHDFSNDETFYKCIYDNIMDAVLFSASDGRIFFANQAACALFGMTVEEICEKGRAGIVDPEDSRLQVLQAERALHGASRCELLLIKKDGTKFPGEVSSSIFKISTGEERICIIIRDLTEIRKVEDELRKSKEGFKSYFENGPVGMCVNSPDNTWTEINQEFCRLLGYEKEELFAMEWSNITHPDDILANEELIRKVKSGELDHFKMEKRYIRKDGETIYATLSLITSRNPDGSINYMIASFIDNTEHYKAVESLVHERQLLRTLVDNLPFPIYFIDKDGKKVIANKADLENIGCTDERLVLGKTDEEFFPNEVGQRGHADNLSVLQSGQPILNREEDFINKNGEQRWLQTTKIPLFDANNQISGLVGIGLDVTQQRRLQQKIKESEAYYRTLVNISPDGIVVTDQLGCIDFISYKVCEIIGFPEDMDLIGTSIFSWVAPEDLEYARRSFQNVLENQLPEPTRIFKCLKYDGSTFWGEFSSSPLEHSKDQVRSLMIVFRDVTNRKQAEEDILLAKNKAEESDRLKSAFLQNISHEIRTPMNSINGFLEILEDPGFSRNEKKLYANIVNKSGQRLLNTIHDIIEISKIMTSKIEINPTQVEMYDFVREHYKNFKPLMEEKGLNFNLFSELKEPFTILIDEIKLEAVLTKILDNAYKFTMEGSVDLRIQILENTLIFKVIDTGIGIEPEKLSAVFQPFFQTDFDFNRRYEGAGLGLSISKAYVELLGGEIWIESNPEIGSKVCFSIPIIRNEE